jgi:hypothetical protein
VAAGALQGAIAWLFVNHQVFSNRPLPWKAKVNAKKMSPASAQVPGELPQSVKGVRLLRMRQASPGLVRG